MLALLSVAAGLIFVAHGMGLFQREGASSPSVPEERLVPTAAPGRVAASSWLTETFVPSLLPSANIDLGDVLYAPRDRIGFVAPMRDVERYDVERLGAGWYISCQKGDDPVPGAGMECAQLVGVTGGVPESDLAALEEVAASNPGRLWLVGNEPDVIWQLNATPEEYAHLYHDIHQALKEADPTCQVAIGGVSQVTPLRLRYLEEIMAVHDRSYGEPIPVDVWNIHLAILREERGTWGVDIPPGMPDDVGMLYEIEDNGDIELLKDQVVAFRRWMAEHGLRNKPLIVTEFSILMPPEYGFPIERVQSFMLAAFDFLMTSSDEDLGYPPDDNRLVQRWAWYSVADTVYATGNLFDPDTGQITALGKTFAVYAASWQ